MTDTNLKELMIHVERIVRPVRARDARKLAMRRELLGHLHAAMAEELASGADQKRALERAKHRLGEATELTRGLQSTVPKVERMLLGYVPMPRWVERWERKRMEKAGMEKMTLGQMGMSTLGAIVISYGTIVTLGMVYVSKYRDVLQRLMVDHGWKYVLGHILGNVLLVLFLGVCFKLLGRTVRGTAKTGTLIKYGIGIGAILTTWMVIVVGMVAGQIPGWAELAWCPAMVPVVVGGFMGLGRLVERMGRGHGEWLELAIE